MKVGKNGSVGQPSLLQHIFVKALDNFGLLPWLLSFGVVAPKMLVRVAKSLFRVELDDAIAVHLRTLIRKFRLRLTGRVVVSDEVHHGLDNSFQRNRKSIRARRGR